MPTTAPDHVLEAPANARHAGVVFERAVARCPA
jgi:hypothetical protein